ncbi:hypothetical protein I4U23_005543 [Adineta vaga]|nr:hypothetical protein I4U23_005543 [Adineta vaga]
MNELSPKFHVKPSGYTSNFTFAELSKRNISNGDLYSWFAPIDLIEHYQLYLNNLEISSNEIKEEIFYNCTENRFGSMCQYQFNQELYSDDITVYVKDFYAVQPFSETLTCYIFIQCDLYSSKVCLDWTEVCNGKVDCLNGPFDEEYCSEVDINDPVYERIDTRYTNDRKEGILPTLLVEDAKCHNLVLTSSCVRGRQERLFEAMLSINDGSVSSNYMFYIPVIPILFNNIYFAYEKTDVFELCKGSFREPYICYNNSLYDDYFASNSMVLFNGDLYPHDGEYIYYLCENDKNSRQPKKHPVLFQSICNRHTELLPKLIHERNEIDESECDFWPCNNLYTRCNRFWNCVNSEDEFHCVKSLISNCSSNEYQCISIHTKQLICLSNNKINDDQIDCLNAVDEQNKISKRSTSEEKIPCHRGLLLHICYYGSHCEFQNQRVSLSVKFQTFLDSRQTLFEIIIQLIDNSNERTIHSHIQLTYLFVRDCQLISFYYLLYSTRRKDQEKNYFIHIDIYEKNTFDYRGSLSFPIRNLFLPVHRFNLTIDIPPTDFNSQHCPRNHRCIHGKCLKYFNSEQEKSFCQCYSGWYGQYCNIPSIINCVCSSDSLRLGIDAYNRSICICPMHKFGPRCFIDERICSLNGKRICNNHGQCILPDLNKHSTNPCTCLCSKGFSGDYCEYEDNKINLSFEKKISLLKTIFIHFLHIEKIL